MLHLFYLSFILIAITLINILIEHWLISDFKAKHYTWLSHLSLTLLNEVGTVSIPILSWRKWDIERLRNVCKDITALHNRTEYKRGTWPQILSYQSVYLLHPELYKTLVMTFPSCLLSCCMQWRQRWQIIPGVLDGKGIVNLCTCKSQAQPWFLLSPRHVGKLGVLCHIMGWWCPTQSFLGNTRHFMILAISPCKLTCMLEQVSWKLYYEPQLHSEKMHHLSIISRNMRESGNRGCLKEAGFCKWEKEVGEINVSACPLPFLLWIPPEYGNYLK